MKQQNLRRVVASASAITLTAGVAAAFGITTATAAPGEASWSDGYTDFKRSVTDANPAIGDTITMTTTFGRRGDKAEKVRAVKDLHHPCLTYVSAYPNNSLTTGTEKAGQDFTRIEFQSGWWNDPGKSLPFTFTYKVGENCPIGVPLTSAMHYTGDFGNGAYENKGPDITVQQGATGTTAAISRALQTGQSTTVTATVDPAVDGEVEFFNGTTRLGKATLANGTAAVDWTPGEADAGQRYSITAKFLGNEGRTGSTSTALTGTVAAADGTGGVTDGENDGGTDGGAGSLGSLGSLGTLFGSLAG